MGGHDCFLENRDVRTIAFDPRVLGAALKEMVLDENTILYTHFLNLKSLLAVKSALKNKQCTLVIQEHMRVDFEEDQTRRGLAGSAKSFLKSKLYKYAGDGCRLIGVSDAVYSDLCSLCGSRDTYLVRNAISTERLDGHRENILSLDSARDVVIFGTHFDRKGVDVALRAVIKARNGLRLVVLTHREDDAIERLDEVESEWRDFCVVKHVVEDIACVYDHALCFISPSRSEAFGYAVAEAAYCDAQVIASDIPGQNSMKCIPGIQWVSSENELAEALVNCYEMNRDRPKELEEQKQAQRAYIHEHFSLDKWCDEVMEVMGLNE